MASLADKIVTMPILSKYKELQDLLNTSFFVAKSDIATANKAGVVKVGEGLTVSTDGTISAPYVLTNQAITAGASLENGKLYFVYE